MSWAMEAGVWEAGGLSLSGARVLEVEARAIVTLLVVALVNYFMNQWQQDGNLASTGYFSVTCTVTWDTVLLQVPQIQKMWTPS